MPGARVAPPEPFEDLVPFGRGDARALVGDGDGDARGRAPDPTSTAVSAGACLTALWTRFATARWTLGPSTGASAEAEPCNARRTERDAAKAATSANTSPTSWATSVGRRSMTRARASRVDQQLAHGVTQPLGRVPAALQAFSVEVEVRFGVAQQHVGPGDQDRRAASAARGWSPRSSRRCTCADRSSRSSIASNAAASPIASVVPCAPPTRRLRSEASIASAASRIRSKGRTARPDHHQASASGDRQQRDHRGHGPPLGSTPVCRDHAVPP